MWRIARSIYSWLLYPWRLTNILEWTEREAKKWKDRITKYKKQLTIAVVGFKGHGKSAFVNSVHSALLGQFVVPAFTMTATGNATTKQIKTYYPDEDQNICILDCEGYGAKENDNDEFNINVMETILNTGKWQETHNEKKTEYAVDAVILCVEYTPDFRDSKNKKLTREIVRLLATCNIPVFPMITHIDCVEKNQDDFIVRDVFKDRRFEEAVQSASHLLKRDKNTILLQCNNNDNNQISNVEKNILTLYNLCFVLDTVSIMK